jgi:type II secretory pathway component PulK
MSSAPTGENNSRGIILVVVLWAIAMMTVIVVALSAYSQKNLSLAGVETNRLRSELALQAGLDVGEAMILARRPEERVFFDGTPVTADIGGERLVELEIMDAAGLADINRADQALIAALMARLELSEEGTKVIIDAIMKLREARLAKKDGEPTSQQQLQQQQLQQDAATAPAEGQPPLPAIFFSTAQLYGLDGADPADVDKLLPFISLYSSAGKVNPMAAPEVIMRSIPDLAPEQIETLYAARQRKQWKAQDVEDILAEHENFLAVGGSKVFVIGVKVVSGRGLIAGSRLRAIVIADEAGKAPFQVLAWSW